MTDVTQLIDKCIVDDEKKSKSNYAAWQYNSVLKILREIIDLLE